jgi:hypothetical protein
MTEPEQTYQTIWELLDPNQQRRFDANAEYDGASVIAWLQAQHVRPDPKQGSIELLLRQLATTTHTMDGQEVVDVQLRASVGVKPGVLTEWRAVVTGHPLGKIAELPNENQEAALGLCLRVMRDKAAQVEEERKNPKPKEAKVASDSVPNAVPLSDKLSNRIHTLCKALGGRCMVGDPSYDHAVPTKAGTAHVKTAHHRDVLEVAVWFEKPHPPIVAPGYSDGIWCARTPALLMKSKEAEVIVGRLVVLFSDFMTEITA